MRGPTAAVAGGVLLGLLTTLAAGCARQMADGASASGAGAPVFEVDPFWPRPLPNNWLMGQAAGVAVDRRDHVWVVQRPKSLTEDERGATLKPPRSLCWKPRAMATPSWPKKKPDTSGATPHCMSMCSV